MEMKYLLALAAIGIVGCNNDESESRFEQYKMDTLRSELFRSAVQSEVDRRGWKLFRGCNYSEDKQTFICERECTDQELFEKDRAGFCAECKDFEAWKKWKESRSTICKVEYTKK